MATFIDSNTQDSAGAQDLTFTIPAAAQSGDFMVCFVKQSENTGQQTWDDDGGGGNGWTREVYNRTTGGRDMESAIYWKFHTGSETNPTFTWDVAGTNEQMGGALLVYRTVDSNVPFSGLTHLNAQNDGNPPNPNVTVDYNNSTVICFHGATHDDISGTAPPTGFTMRAEIYGGSAQHSADHRDLFVADINGIAAQSYAPPDWQHTVANTTPEYHTYTMALNDPQPIGIFTNDASMFWGETDKIVTGFGFGASQLTGLVEIWSDTIGTLKVTQTIDTWADGSIQFDLVQGALPNNTTNYLVVTNDSGDVSPARAIGFGLLPYQLAVLGLNPDHLWALDGDYVDTGLGGALRDMTQSIVGTHPFVSAIAEDATQAMQFDDVLDRREAPDSPYMNITIDSDERTVAGWIALGTVQQALGAIWKEGGGVQNLAFITGLGNVLMAQIADTPGNIGNAQSVSEIRLTAGRPYHILLAYSLSTNYFRLFLDGEEQPLGLTNGVPLAGANTFNSHSGDLTWGNSDNNLETGGTDIAYAGQEDCTYQHWCSWSDNSVQTGLLDSTNEIRDVLFRRGASPDTTIATDTTVNMQSDFVTQVQSTVLPDWPLAIRVEECSDSSNLTLNAVGVTFDSRCTLQLEWRGLGVLTYVVDTGSELDDTKLYASAGGSIVVQRPSTFTIDGLINGGELRIYDNNGASGSLGDELAGIEVLSGTSFQYSHDGSTNDIVVQFQAVGYTETTIPHQISSTDETLTLNPKVEIN